MDIKISPKSSGWEEVIISIGGDKHEFCISGVSGESVGTILTTMYCLLSEEPVCYCPEFMQRMDFELSTEDYRYLQEIKKDVDIEPCGKWDMLYKAEFVWDEEPNSIRWTIEKPLTIQDDFTLKIKIELSGENCREYVYEVDFREFCYALTKALTEALKTAGICGYCNETWRGDFKVEQFILVKAFALNRMEEFRPQYSEKLNLSCSDIQNELALIMQDM